VRLNPLVALTVCHAEAGFVIEQGVASAEVVVKRPVVAWHLFVAPTANGRAIKESLPQYGVASILGGSTGGLPVNGFACFHL
jgi:hypothetical protein